MKTLNKATLAFVAALPLLALSLPSQAATSFDIETALTDVCKAAMHNKSLDFTRLTKSYHLTKKTIAMKVMCNGEDIISFAERHGSNKIADKLENSIGNVSITDTAAVTKINVRFQD